MSVLVKEVIEKLRLDIVYGEPELLEKEINTADITRPGLEMTGYFDYYTPERIQLLGMKEWSYLISMPSNSRYEVLKKMFLPETPAVIVARGLVVPEEMLKAARECKIAILTSRTAWSASEREKGNFLSRIAVAQKNRKNWPSLFLIMLVARPRVRGWGSLWSRVY